MSINRIEISADLLRGAQACVGKNDVRYYLNGIFLSKSGDILSSNGHVGFISKHKTQVNEDVLINIESAIPKKADLVAINIYDDGNIVFECAKNRETFKKICGCVVSIGKDQKYPDVRGLIPSIEKITPKNNINIRGEYISIAQKALEVNWAINMEFYENMAVCKNEEKTVLIMLSRA